MEELLKKKSLKIGGGILGGSSVVAALFSFAVSQGKDLKEYVNLKTKLTEQRLESIRNNQKEILKKLEKIDDRLYNLIKKGRD